MGNPLKLTKCQVQGLLMLGIPLLLLGPWIGLAFYAQLYKKDWTIYNDYYDHLQL